jgi:hypothetical protein
MAALYLRLVAGVKHHVTPNKVIKCPAGAGRNLPPADAAQDGVRSTKSAHFRAALPKLLAIRKLRLQSFAARCRKLPLILCTGGAILPEIGEIS